jgi:glycerophosphoryl diester phosphodiesterase
MLNAKVAIVAHRGMAAGYPDTLAAFRHSVSAGFTAIEVNLRATADRHIVIMHDEAVDRHWRVGRMAFAEVWSLDAGSHAGPGFVGQRVPQKPRLRQPLDYQEPAHFTQ